MQGKVENNQMKSNQTQCAARKTKQMQGRGLKNNRRQGKTSQCKTTLSEQASAVLSKANTINVLTTSTQQKYIVVGLAFPERLLGILLGILRVYFWGILLDDHWDQIYLDTDEVEKILEHQANAK